MAKQLGQVETHSLHSLGQESVPMKILKQLVCWYCFTEMHATRFWLFGKPLCRNCAENHVRMT